MPVSVLSLVLLSLAVVGRHIDSAIIERDIAIIGGGSSGTHCAISLKDRHKSVVVIERDSILGGNTDTFLDKTSGKHVNVGVQVLHYTKGVHEYVTKRLGVPIKIQNVLAEDLTRRTIYADFNTGKTVEVPTFDSSAFLKAAQTYLSIYNAKFVYLLDGEGTSRLPNPIPTELMVPFPGWAKKNNVSTLTPLFARLQGNLGDIFKVSTLDVLKSAPPSLINSVLTGFYVVSSGDTQDIYTAAAKVLSDNVFYNSTPLSIKRNKESVIVVVQTPKGQKTIRAKQLIVAVPPLLNDLPALDATSSEKALFANFSGVGYFGAVTSNPGVNASVNNFDPAQPFGIFSQPGLNFLGPNVADKLTVYGSTAKPVSDTEAKRLMKKQLDTLQSTGVVPRRNITVEYLTNHSPFWLTAPTEKVRQGFWRDVYCQVQGKQKTFWTGAAWAAYDSTLIWEYNDKVVIPGVLAALGG